MAVATRQSSWAYFAKVSYDCPLPVVFSKKDPQSDPYRQGHRADVEYVAAPQLPPTEVLLPEVSRLPYGHQQQNQFGPML